MLDILGLVVVVCFVFFVESVVFVVEFGVFVVDEDVFDLCYDFEWVVVGDDEVGDFVGFNGVEFVVDVEDFCGVFCYYVDCICLV